MNGAAVASSAETSGLKGTDTRDASHALEDGHNRKRSIISVENATVNSIRKMS